MVTISKRGAIYYAQYRHDGKQTRVSLKTSNRKVAEQHRLKLELDLAQRSLGLAPVEPVASEQEEPVELLAEVRSGYEAFSKANKRPKTVLNDTSRLNAFFEAVPVEQRPDHRAPGSRSRNGCRRASCYGLVRRPAAGGSLRIRR